MKWSRNEIFDLLDKEISDELLLAISEERDTLFAEMTKHRNIADAIAYQVQSYNRVIDQNVERITELLNNNDQGTKVKNIKNTPKESNKRVL
jgi:hypothetical protein